MVRICDPFAQLIGGFSLRYAFLWPDPVGYYCHSRLLGYLVVYLGAFPYRNIGVFFTSITSSLSGGSRGRGGLIVG